MCGITAVILAEPNDQPAAVTIHYALYLLQHRGQDAAGIVTCGPGDIFHQFKGNGLTSKVFDDGARLVGLPGYMGLGHLRYPTAGSSASAEAQPFYVNSPNGICFTHNGNLVNAPQLREFLRQKAHRHINTSSDSELMLNVFANELNETGKVDVNPDDCFAALGRMYKLCVGSWACTAMLAGFGLIGFRDPYGIRPIVLGSKPSESGVGMDYMMASESVALTQCGYRTFQDILPGQAVIIERGKQPVFRQVHPMLGYTPDIFEYVYFARPDSIIDGIDVDESRIRMGRRLAETIKRQLGPEKLAEIDVVMPIPETATTSAVMVADALGKPYVQGFVKNRFVFRTFLLPSQQLRQQKVRQKLNPLPNKIKDRNVLLVDDSIVRGTTSREIVLMARSAGAKKVYFSSCAPPITNAHIYGIDLPSPSALVAHHNDPSAIAKIIGADDVIYQTLPDLEESCASLSPRDPATQKFEIGMFCGHYVTPVDEDYFEHLERIRGESRKIKAEEEASKLAMLRLQQQLRVGAKGVEVDQHGNVVPAGNNSPVWGPFTPGVNVRSGAPEHSNGTHRLSWTNSDRVTSDGFPMKGAQDISLHNQNEFA